VPWGWSIVLLTVVVRAVLIPLTVKQFGSMQRMQQLQPEMKAIQAKYKEDKERQQQEMMRFYKENKVNPLGSCLPLVAQLPVFISLFYMLRTTLRLDICAGHQPRLANGLINTAHLRPCGVGHGAGFLFIGDLTNKATGVTLIVLLALYVGSQLASSLMMSSATMDRNQRMIMLVMPLFFVFIFLQYPAGLLVYWITTNMWTIAQQFVVKRRIGPARLRRSVVPERVIDWGDVAPFSLPGAPVRLRTPHERLRELQPGELADLLEDLGRSERHELLTALAPDTAADVLEEMDQDDLTEMLRDAAPSLAADLLGRMEPDEAVDALRSLADDDRDAILTAMPTETADHLTGLLAYPKREAGGIMTTHLVMVHAADTVAGVRAVLRERRAHSEDVDAVVVVDEDGRLLDDVPLFDLLVADGGVLVGSLVGPPWPATVTVDADLDRVVDKLIANRGSSLLVVDGSGHPLGRILADDVLDVLAATRGRRWPWQQR